MPPGYDPGVGARSAPVEGGPRFPPSLNLL
jgi:hypothetical protein